MIALARFDVKEFQIGNSSSLSCFMLEEEEQDQGRRQRTSKDFIFEIDTFHAILD